MITVCIPSLNRKESLMTLLSYYSEYGFNHKIFVGISDSLEVFEELLTFKNNLLISDNISFFHAPNLGVLETLNFLLTKVSTKYCIFQSDDDFLINDSLSEMQKILDQYEGYIGVNAKALILNESTGELSNYHMRGIYQETSSLRLEKFSENYFAIHMALFRLQHLKDIFNLPAIKSKPIREEIYVSFKSAITGKIFHLNSLFLIRTIAHSRTNLGTVDFSDISSIETFKGDMVDQIIRLDKVIKSSAEKCFNTALSKYAEKSSKVPFLIGMRNIIERSLMKILRIMLNQKFLSIYDLSFYRKWRPEINSVKKVTMFKK